MEEIKEPCPFCGISPEYHDEFTPILDVIEVQDGRLTVKCGNCGAIGPLAETPEGAVKQWNKRAHNERSKR